MLNQTKVGIKMYREVFNTLLEKNKNTFPISELNEEDIKILKQKNNSIKSTELYKHKFHGMFHSQKVMLFAYLIGKKNNLSEDEMKILLDAAIYHDIGRTNDFEETTHGYISALKLDRLLKDDEFYNDEANLNILKAICDGHSQPDSKKDNNFENNGLDKSLYDKYSVLYDILKDADALDRARFSKSAPESIKEEFLRYDYSKSIVNFAFAINKDHQKMIDTYNYEKYKIEFQNTEKEYCCLHGIGWDFGKLESILDFGILSKYAAENEKVQISRNFEGNNSSMWISVIDSKDVANPGGSYEEFIENNICFYSQVGKYKKGDKSKGKAYSEGLPIDSGLYDDESFVFDKIPKEDILFLILPNKAGEKRLIDLNYLHCCNGYKTVTDRVNYFKNYILKTCDLEVDTENVNKLLEYLSKIEIDFGKKTPDYQKENMNSFFQKTTDIVNTINSEICKWMHCSFKNYFKLNNEDPTVGMMVKDILERKNIDYISYNDSNEMLIELHLNQKGREDNIKK